MTADKTILKVKALSKSFNNSPVFSDLSFNLTVGGTLALVGPSGCGKSTLLHIVAGLIKDYKGQVEKNPHRARCSLVMQRFGLFPWKKAVENVALPLIINGLKRTESLARAEAGLIEIGLGGLGERYPAQLSGGQCQRLALGRAIISEPDLLLLDEPFSSLDAIAREKLQNLLLDLRDSRGLTYLLATHSIEEAVFLGQNILVMGGSPTQVLAEFNNPIFGQRQARFEDQYFDLVKKIRRLLEDSGALKEADL